MKKSLPKLAMSVVRFVGLLILLIVVFTIGLFYTNPSLKAKPVVKPEQKTEYPQYNINEMDSYNYNGWIKFTYSEGDFSFMVPSGYVVFEQKQNSTSPCNNKILIYKSGKPIASDIQIDKCPQKVKQGYAEILSGNNGYVFQIRLGGVDGYLRKGVFNLYGGDVTGQELMVYRDNYAFSIFRNLDSSQMNDDQFDQILSSFKFSK